MKIIFISSNFTDEIQSHYDSSEADVLRPQAVKKKRLKRQGNTKENTIVDTTKRSSRNHTCVEFVGKTLSDSSNIKRHEKSQRCAEAKDQCLVKLVLINIILILIKTNYII